MQYRDYAVARPMMREGDVIAFGGKGRFSDIIKWATRAPVSHVGVVLQTHRATASRPGHFNQVIESTTLDGFSGVVVSKLSERLACYTGEVWWLSLAADVRERMDADRLMDFLIDQKGKEYDFPQASLSGLDRLGPLTRADEDFGRFFCSDLVAAALEEAGAIRPINASEVTPIDLCRWAIYREAVQIKGPLTDPKIVPNTC